MGRFDFKKRDGCDIIDVSFFVSYNEDSAVSIKQVLENRKLIDRVAAYWLSYSGRPFGGFRFTVNGSRWRTGTSDYIGYYYRWVELVHTKGNYFFDIHSCEFSTRLKDGILKIERVDLRPGNEAKNPIYVDFNSFKTQIMEEYKRYTEVFVPLITDALKESSKDPERLAYLLDNI